MLFEGLPGNMSKGSSDRLVEGYGHNIGLSGGILLEVNIKEGYFLVRLDSFGK